MCKFRSRAFLNIMIDGICLVRPRLQMWVLEQALRKCFLKFQLKTRQWLFPTLGCSLVELPYWMFPSLPYIVIPVVCLSQFWTKFVEGVYIGLFTYVKLVDKLYLLYILQNGGQAKLQRISINQEMWRKQHLDNIFERYKWFDKKPYIFGMLGGTLFKLFRYLQDIWSIIHTIQSIQFVQIRKSNETNK